MMATYTEVPANPFGDNIELECPQCKNIIKKRRDSFVPGLHQVICVKCDHESTAVDLLTGEHREVRDQDRRQPSDAR
jgi:hypothetical protein